MLEWWQETVSQYPIAILALGAVAICAWWLEKGHRAELSRLEKLLAESQKSSKAEISRQAKLLRMYDARHIAEIDRLMKSYDDQLAQLHETIRNIIEQERP